MTAIGTRKQPQEEKPVTKHKTGRRRRLSTDELDRILTGIEAAGDTGDLLTTVVRELYNVLLSDTGRSLDTLEAGERIDPRKYAIPSVQWHAIATAAGNRAAQFGTTPQVSLSLLDVMPSSYEDPAVSAPALSLKDWRPYLHDLHVSREATDVIRECTEHVAAIGLHFGTNTVIYRRAAGSWLRHLSGLFAMSFGADTRITPDGKLSLTVATSSGFVYGIIFHGDRRWCALDGCRAVIGDDGTVRPGFTGSVVHDHQHVPSYPLGAPQPGEWNVHS
jgi:hypothetical protein